MIKHSGLKRIELQQAAGQFVSKSLIGLQPQQEFAGDIDVMHRPHPPGDKF